MSKKYDWERSARTIGGAIGRAVVRALRVDQAMVGKDVVDRSLLNLELVLERGRVEGARTVAVCVAYQFSIESADFDRSEFYDLVLQEAYRTQANEFNKAKVGTTNFYQAWINDHAWYEYSTK